MSVFRCTVHPDSYRDSVFLMKISGKLSQLPGVEMASAMMATDRNKDLFRDSGLWNDEVAQAKPDDLVVALRANDEESAQKALDAAEDLLTAAATRETASEGAKAPARIDQLQEDFNICMISTAGDYAKFEAAKALNAGMNVMLYSDNISVPDELELKQLAHKKGLIVMGPDCGTAIIGGAPLAFANEIRSGTIGIVGASGTGMQEVSTIIHRKGGGVSHAFGTGGRDVSAAIGGITMMDCLQLLAEDTATQVIAIVAKPPCNEVTQKIADFIKSCPKPVVVTFAGIPESSVITEAGGQYGASLGDAADLALKSAGIDPVPFPPVKLPEKLRNNGTYLRGIFCGGSLCHEALDTAAAAGLGDLYANLEGPGVKKLEDVSVSKANTFLDMGEDQFTVGKPHPMIDPFERNKRLRQELADPEVAVIVTDCVIGYGSCMDGAQTLAAAVKEAGDNAPLVISSVCGTEEDPQCFSKAVADLEQAGVIVAPTNMDAIRAALELLK